MAESAVLAAAASVRGRGRQGFADFLAALSVLGYARIAELCILEAMRADPGSDWHWKTAACWGEAVRRGCPGLYDRAVRRVSGDSSVLPACYPGFTVREGTRGGGRDEREPAAPAQGRAGARPGDAVG